MIPRLYDQSVTEQDTGDVAAFVLAGGKSSRMGKDKAFLKLGKETLLERALRLAHEITPDVRIVGERAKFAAFAAVLEDVYRDRGPLGGIHAALQGSSAAFNLMVAVDVPFVEARFLHYLVGEARASDAMATVAQVCGGFQPLCAVYRREFAQAADHALRAGKNKIDALFAMVQTRVVTETDLTGLGFSPEMFGNLNTPEDWERAKKRVLA